MLKAEGLIAGKPAATHVWKKPGTAAKLVLVADRPVLTADGADISRIIVSAVDAQGTEVPLCSDEVTFSIEGNGQLIGENPVKLRAGKMMILAQSSFVPGNIKISASAKGLAADSTRVTTQAVSSDTDIPASLPVRKPTTARLIVRGGNAAVAKAQPLVFQPKKNVAPGVWIESDPIMLDVSSPISITGGEYRIYTAPWTTNPGRAGGGDAIFVRVKSAANGGGTAKVELSVGGKKIPFEVTTLR